MDIFPIRSLSRCCLLLVAQIAKQWTGSDKDTIRLGWPLFASSTQYVIQQLVISWVLCGFYVFCLRSSSTSSSLSLCSYFIVIHFGEWITYECSQCTRGYQVQKNLSSPSISNNLYEENDYHTLFFFSRFRFFLSLLFRYSFAHTKVGSQFHPFKRKLFCISATCSSPKMVSAWELCNKKKTENEETNRQHRFIFPASFEIWKFLHSIKIVCVCMWR